MPTRARLALSPPPSAPGGSPPPQSPRPHGFPGRYARGRSKARHSNQSWPKPLRGGAATCLLLFAAPDKSVPNTLYRPAWIPPAAPAPPLTHPALRSHKSDHRLLPQTAAPPFPLPPSPLPRCPLQFRHRLPTVPSPPQPPQPSLLPPRPP